jgi:ribonuclease P protein component
VFPQKERLTRSSFPSALRFGKRIQSRNFSAIIPKEGVGIAVVVSKKTAKLAVARHRIKRRVLSALAHIPHPSSLIVFPQAQAEKMRYDEMVSELSLLLKNSTH